MGRTGLQSFKAIASTYHHKLKFLNINKVGDERRDQNMTQSCYIASLKPEEVGGQVFPIEDMDVEKMRKNGESLLKI